MKPHSVLPVILALAAGCTPTIKTQNEVTIKPVQVTLDINLKVDQALTEALSADAPGSAAAAAADADSAQRRARRDRMAARRDRIRAWKLEKLVGENNSGLLELRVDPAAVTGEVALTVAEENKDRSEMFRAIADQQNSTPEVVGRRFAARFADRAVPGTLRQTPSGEWICVPAAE